MSNLNKDSELMSRLLEEDEYVLWDELVDVSPHGTVFHSSDWLKTCRHALGVGLKIFACFRDGKLVGGCSVFEHKMGRVFKVLSSNVKLSPYGGVVTLSPESPKRRAVERNHHSIIESLTRAIDKTGIPNKILFCSPDLMDVRPFTSSGWDSEVVYTYRLDLTNFEASGDVARNAKKAARNGISVELSSNLERYAELYEQTYLRQGIAPPVSKDFINEMVEMLHKSKKGELWAAMAEDGEMAAGEVYLFDKRRAYRWTAATHQGLRNTGAYTLLLTEAAKAFKERGIPELDMAAANTPHLAEFATAFEPALVPNYRLQKTTALFKLSRRIAKALKTK